MVSEVHSSDMRYIDVIQTRFSVSAVGEPLRILSQNNSDCSMLSHKNPHLFEYFGNLFVDKIYFHRPCFSN